jgi:hypothetical protein
MQLITNKVENLLSRFADRPLLSLVVLLGISFFIKALLIYQVEIINSDGIRYINSARELFQGDISSAFAHEKMLGFTFLLGLTHLVVPDWFLAGKVLSSVALILTTIPMYFIALELFGRRAAFFTALIFTVAPVFNGKCKSVIKDPVSLLLIVTALCLIIYALKEFRLSLAFLAGVLSTLSVLVRPEGALFLLIITLFLSACVIFQPADRKLTLKCLCAFCAFPFGIFCFVVVVFAAGVVPPENLSRIYLKFSYYFSTDFTLSYGNIYQHLKDVEATFPGGQWANDYFEFARKYLLLIYLFGMSLIFLELISPFFLVPLFFGLNLKGMWCRSLLLLLSVLVGFFCLDYFFIVTRNFLANRYMLLPVTLGFVFVGYGTDRIVSALQNTRFRDAVCCVAIVLCLFLPVARKFYKLSDEKHEIKHAGVWLRDNRDLTRVKLIVNNERIAYYAGLFRDSYKISESGNFNLLKENALKEGYELIVAYQKKADIDEDFMFDGFSLVETFEGRKNVAMIYERKI